ncbi:MAG: hypothetical protein ACTSPF_13595 [Candidatus Heimdallarchaeaceae archaeon]
MNENVTIPTYGTVELTLGVLINKLNRDSLDLFTKRVRRYLKYKLKAMSIDVLEVNTFLIFTCSFPLEEVENDEQRKIVVNQVEKIIHDYCKKECGLYAKQIRKNVEIRDITKMIVQLVKSSTSEKDKSLLENIAEIAAVIDDRVIYHVSDVLLNSFIAIWDFPRDYPDIIMFPDLILKREVIDKKQNIPLRLIAENLLIMQFGKACSNNLKPILKSVEEAILTLENLLQDSKKIKNLEENMSNKLWKTLRVIFGLLSSTQQVVSVQLKQINRIAQVRNDLVEEVKKLDYAPLLDYLMLLDSIMQCSDHIERLNNLQTQVKQNYQTLLNIINHFKDVPEREVEDVKDVSLIFIKTLAEIQLMKFFSDKFRDLAYFQTIPTEVSLEKVEKIHVDSDIILKGVALFKTYRLVGSTVYALRGIDVELKKGEMARRNGCFSWTKWEWKDYLTKSSFRVRYSK